MMIVICVTFPNQFGVMSKAVRNTISDLFEGGVKLPYKTGEIILRAGNTPLGVYLITKGTVNYRFDRHKWHTAQQFGRPMP
jgi:signal-transduction protein with cAMP-binding, CBS, and nucleotidyltransferase domain